MFCAGPVISHGFIILAMLGGLTQEGWVHTEGLTGNDLGLSSHVFIFLCAAELESADGAMGAFRRGNNLPHEYAVVFVEATFKRSSFWIPVDSFS